MLFLFFFALLALLSFGLLKGGTVNQNAVLYAFFALSTMLSVLFFSTVLRKGQWRGISALLPVLILAVGFVLAVCVGFDLGYGQPPILQEWLLAPLLVPPWIAVAGGGFIGLFAVTISASRGDCVGCRDAIRPWQKALACGRHGGAARFHERCLYPSDQQDFCLHERERLALLIKLSRGDLSVLSDRTRRGDRRTLFCGLCLRTRALDALSLHCAHSDFLVPYQNVIRHAELCSVCRCPAAEGPNDRTLVPYGTDATYAAGIEQDIERYKLGPMVACPHCDTKAHLMCWHAQGGCINRGNRGTNGQHCHMPHGKPQMPNFFEEGWPTLCAEHAREKGWNLPSAQPHVDVESPDDYKP